MLCVDISPTDPTLWACGDMSGAVTIFKPVLDHAPDTDIACGGGTEAAAPPSGETVLAHFTDNSKYVVRVKFSPDGTQLATASYDKTVHLYTATAGSGGACGGWELKRSWPFAGTVECVEWVAEHTVCAAVRESNLLRLLDTEDFSVEEVKCAAATDDADNDGAADGDLCFPCLV